jgi:hypothetical protein
LYLNVGNMQIWYSCIYCGHYCVITVWASDLSACRLFAKTDWNHLICYLKITNIKILLSWKKEWCRTGMCVCVRGRVGKDTTERYNCRKSTCWHCALNFMNHFYYFYSTIL